MAAWQQDNERRLTDIIQLSIKFLLSLNMSGRSKREREYQILPVGFNKSVHLIPKLKPSLTLVLIS